MRPIASIIFKRMMILYLEKESDTGFYNHMWKTLKGKLDGIANAVWGQELLFFFFLNSPQNTGAEEGGAGVSRNSPLQLF